MMRIATGVNALSIWIYETLRYKYAVLLRMRLPLNNNPIGNMDCMNISFVIRTSLVPSRRFVVRCKTRVPIAAKVRCHVTVKTGYLKLSVLYR